MNIYLEIAERLIRQYGHPLRPRELADFASDQGLFSDSFAGKTPHKTFHARLSVEIIKNGNYSIFVRTEPGHFFLRSLLPASETDGDVKIFQAPRRKPPSPTEEVLVVPISLLNQRKRFQGINKNWRPYVQTLSQSKYVNYIDRLVAEESDHLRQIITYIMMVSGNKILCFKRGQYNRVAEFLRGAYCVGFGGHVTQADVTIFDRKLAGLNGNVSRELTEEIRLPPEDYRRLLNGEGLSVVGVLNDFSSVVGRRHFAFIFRYEVSNDSYWKNPKRGEASVTDLHWTDLEDDKFDLNKFEYWSQLCLRTFFQDCVKAQSSFRIVRRRPFRPPHVICVVGKIGSGKSAITKELINSFGYRVVNVGRTLAKLIDLPPIPRTPRDVFQKHAERFIQEMSGPRKLAENLVVDVNRIAADRIVIDGFRQIETFRRFKELVGKTKVALLYIHTPPDLAYTFFRKREQPICTIDEFFEMYAANVEREIENFLTSADAVIYNWIGQRNLISTLHEMTDDVGITR